MKPAAAAGEHSYSANILTVGPMRSKERWVDELAAGKLDTQKFDNFKNSFLSMWKNLFGSKNSDSNEDQGTFWGSFGQNFRSMNA